jgi:hypothetical protein
MKRIFIDIRKSDEVYSRHFALSDDYSVYYIPMNMIRFNVPNIVQHLDYVDEIFLICQSASRSQFIKDKYFSKYERIRVHKDLQFNALNYGENMVHLNTIPSVIRIVGSDGFNLYNVMRMTQIIMGLLIIMIGSYTYIYTRKNKTYPLLFLIAFGAMVLFNGLTSTCSLSYFLQDYLN